ncbi:MAG: NfeD family protein [Campylobacteraceae bacterium]
MWVLIAGIIVLALEVLTGSFYLIWYGIGLSLSGAVGWAIGSDAWVIQSVIGLLIGLILMFAFRKRFLHKISTNKNRDEFLLVSGKGIVRENGLVEFRGTTWKYESKSNDIFKINEEVQVTPTTSNTVFIEKITK